MLNIGLLPKKSLPTVPMVSKSPLFNSPKVIVSGLPFKPKIKQLSTLASANNGTVK